MHIAYVEIANFRKLQSARIEFAADKTVFVGANNSGKTSAMSAMRYFLLESARSTFSLNDFTLSNWPTIDAIGDEWESANAKSLALPAGAWADILPCLDVWLHVRATETHYVQQILPSLDWAGGLIGVRLRFEQKVMHEFQQAYLSARTDATRVEGAGDKKLVSVTLWPKSLTDFLRRRLNKLFTVKAYILDPALTNDPEFGVAKLQKLNDVSEPLDVDPFAGLIRIDEISAQRGFGDAENARGSGDGDAVPTRERKLSEQLRRYYKYHLDPSDSPDVQDLEALSSIDLAQKAFDARLKDGFALAISEIENLGYPGITDPRLDISTRLSAVDGLKHEGSVQYVVPLTDGAAVIDLRLPEHSNGLGYQNLISMVFRLMSFRDAWMLVGKAEKKAVASSTTSIPPLHLVLVEEPEAHLHAQVQQLFIRQAYNVLRKHKNLGAKPSFTTQLVVSTHSSHVAHECEFSSLRYFRRLAPKKGGSPSACVVNLTAVFGKDLATQRFVTRYLRVTHCDLLFADAAVLIEGPAERILVPYFVETHPDLTALGECYVTWLEIGGSHAHRLRPLVEQLCLTTLVITDLDATSAAGKTEPPKRGANQRSRNETLKTWCPGTDVLDELLNKSSNDKKKEYPDQGFAVRVAYQCPVSLKFKNESAEALANTLEDALVFENLGRFTPPAGKGLFRRIGNVVAKSDTIAELSEGLFDELKGGGKAELALDLLELDADGSLKPPPYMRDGLAWLAAQLRANSVELAVAVSTATVGPSAEAK